MGIFAPLCKLFVVIPEDNCYNNSKMSKKYDKNTGRGLCEQVHTSLERIKT